ncbi:putative transmembrane protein [Mycobacterium tuberculosis]|nr:putative transmembrane protein [Mycobacterium tuberculosis]
MVIADVLDPLLRDLRAAHHPHGYLSQPDPDTPALTGDRTARIAPTIDELGPTLVETVRRHDTLPRIAQAVVVAATRNYGVPDNETDLLHHKTTEIHQAVLTTYPNHDIATVAQG